MRQIRVALAQINTTVGDLAGNTTMIRAYVGKAEARGCDLVAFPELAVCGYPPEDLVLRRRFVLDTMAALEVVATATAGMYVTAIVGFVEMGAGPYNAAAVIHNGRVVGVYRKHHLPNYGVFDEARCFRPGTEAPVFEIAGVGVGINICEDIWYPEGPAQMQARQGAEVIVNINGSPFHAGKIDLRTRMLTTRATDNGVIVCYCNLVGGQDSLIFDGGSMICGHHGEQITAAPMFEETLLVADLDVELVQQIRLHETRYRSDDPHPAWISVSVPRNVSRSVLEQSTAPAPLGMEEAVYRALVLGTRDYAHKTGFAEVVVALSGGIDSAVTAAIATAALGSENVVGVSMPSRYSSEGSIADAKALADNLGIRLFTIPIEGSLVAFLDTLQPLFEGHAPNVAEENMQARIRGTLIMALSNKFGWLVLTTSNKSEFATGYTTLYGDMTGGLAVIQDVPKTLVYRLAAQINRLAGCELIPQATIEKPPSAELRSDQLDEESLMPYARLDPILQAFVEEDRSLDEIVAMGYTADEVRRVMDLVTRAEYKRRQAAVGLKITPRAFGKDRRLPIANRYRGY